MECSDLLIDSFGRIRESVHNVVEGLTGEQLAFRADADANSISWLIWHLTRVQDDHISDVAGHEQLWTAAGWADRFALPFDRQATGYGNSSQEVGQVRPGGQLLLGYHDAVHEATIGYVKGITGPDLDRVIDESWDPPVTLGVRLVSVIDDDAQHVGQAAFARGLAERRAR